MSAESTTPDLVELVQRVVDAVHARDFDAEQSGYAPNAVLDILGLAVRPEDVVHPGLLGGWLVSKPPVPRRTPDEVAR
jgi:hypothetical protein